MILALDTGNTHIVVGCMEGTDTVHSFRVKTDTGRTEYEYAALFRQLLSIWDVYPAELEGAIISSVVPPLTPHLVSAVHMLTGKKPLVVGVGMKTGLNILLEQPSSLGADMVVGSVAALDLYKPPMIVVDMGTVTKLFALDEKGSYLGGSLFPGLVVSLNSLSNSTAQLPMVPLEAPKKAIGTNTVTAMQSGVVFGAAAMIDGIIDRMEEELGGPATLVATGGNAKFVIPVCRHRFICNDDLLMHGLAVLYKKNKK